MSDLEERLRALADLLPDPEEQATDAARRAMHEARASAPWARRRRSWFSRGPRPYLLAAAIALVAAGAALAATHWSLSDLPPFGSDDREAFVLPATDILPGGYERTRPPRYTDLPSRPSLLFAADVDYSEALSQYIASRAKGRILPDGVTLADPLPAGKVVLISDGRVRLDPAAPLGYSATTGLVNVPSGSGSPPIARCQLLLGIDDPNSPSCDGPDQRAYVREGVGGRWIPSENAEALADPLVSASTQLSVIDEPSTPLFPLPPGSILAAFSGSHTPNAAKARLALRTDDVALVVVPATNKGLCLGAIADKGSSWTCGARASMLGRGAVLLSGRSGSDGRRVNGLVGDGITLVRANDGTTASVQHNAFTMAPSDSATRYTFSGPIGSFTLSQSNTAQGPAQSPERSKEREQVGIDLAGGGRASIRVAPNRGGGLCQWLLIRGAVRSHGCTGPDTTLPYDVVTGGLSPGGPGYPFIYSGQFAPEVGAVEMNFADGSASRLSLSDGFVLYEIPASRVDSRTRWPVAVTTYDTDGVALVRNPLRDFGAIVRQQRPDLHP